MTGGATQRIRPDNTNDKYLKSSHLERRRDSRSDGPAVAVLACSAPDPLVNVDGFSSAAMAVGTTVPFEASERNHENDFVQ